MVANRIGQSMVRCQSKLRKVTFKETDGPETGTIRETELVKGKGDEG